MLCEDNDRRPVRYTTRRRPPYLLQQHPHHINTSLPVPYSLWPHRYVDDDPLLLLMCIVVVVCLFVSYYVRYHEGEVTTMTMNHNDLT